MGDSIAGSEGQYNHCSSKNNALFDAQLFYRVARLSKWRVTYTPNPNIKTVVEADMVCRQLPRGDMSDECPWSLSFVFDIVGMVFFPEAASKESTLQTSPREGTLRRTVGNGNIGPVS